MSSIRHEKRHDRAVARAESRAARTPAAQIAVLDAKLGVGVGAKKERARLAKPLAGRSGS